MAALLADIATIVGLLAIGAAAGGMATVAWVVDRRPLIDQFREMHHAPENLEQRARRIQ